MRVAVEQAGTEVGLRAARILLGERDLTGLGVIGGRPKGLDPRVHAATDLADYDVVVTDAPDAIELLEAALDAAVNCVVWGDGAELQAEYGDAFAQANITLLTGANVASGLAPSLATHEVAVGGVVMDTSIAWTEPGTPLRRGEAVSFPDPVGPRWATPRPAVHGYAAYGAPIEGDWAGALAKVTSAGTDGVVTKVVGVADLAVHLEALALASAAMAIDLYSPGAHGPADASEIYLAKALDAGLGVATYTLAE